MQLMKKLEVSAQSPLINNQGDIIKTTGPFFVQDVLNDYSKPSSPSDQVIVVDPEFFMPCFDEITKDYFKKLCDNEKRCVNEDREYVHSVCESMKRRDWTNAPSELSFTDHHWLHTWWLEGGWRKYVLWFCGWLRVNACKTKLTQSIFQIVINVKVFGEGKSK